MLKLIFSAFIFVFLGACQMAPTKIKTEVGRSVENIVLVDTRSSLEYSTYHLSGSVHLSTSDFLILKNVNTQQRQFDPDLEQTIERLAKRGISPNKKIVLISNKKDSEENQKWNWLLKKIQVKNIQLLSLDEYIKANSPLVPKPQPERNEVWSVDNKSEILKQASSCFVNWNSKSCF
jgi:3-mercaptopyruvate sulfurtransferase SseA